MSAASNNKLETLDKLCPGERGTILRLSCATDLLQQKLLSLGLVRSTAIKVTGVAPLGDPINVEVRGVNLALRRSEARGVVVAAAEQS